MPPPVVRLRRRMPARALPPQHNAEPSTRARGRGPRQRLRARLGAPSREGACATSVLTRPNSARAPPVRGRRPHTSRPPPPRRQFINLALHLRTLFLFAPRCAVLISMVQLISKRAHKFANSQSEMQRTMFAVNQGDLAFRRLEAYACKSACRCHCRRERAQHARTKTPSDRNGCASEQDA